VLVVLAPSSLFLFAAANPDRGRKRREKIAFYELIALMVPDCVVTSSGSRDNNPHFLSVHVVVFFFFISSF
jgi:hypothetical protein